MFTEYSPDPSPRTGEAALGAATHQRAGEAALGAAGHQRAGEAALGAATHQRAGEAALARGEWAAARDAFLSAGDAPAVLEGLGWAAWWLCDAGLVLRAREAAYRGHRALGDDAAAGRVAAWLVSDYREFRGEDAVARGWLERAHRLLDPLSESAAHGWLALNEGSFVLSAGDPEEAARLARFAARLGRELRVADLEAVGLAQEGIADVVCGRVPEGMRRLDEASAIAAGEDLQLPLSHGWALCYLISACDGVGDFARATQWCEVMRDVAERWSGRQLMGVCRSNYGRVLATSGDWARGEGELVAALDDLLASKPGQASSGLVRLGELRARQGRTVEARALFSRAGSGGLLGLGELALHDGDPAAAADAAERVLRRLPESDVLGRIPALELLVRARAALREVDRAGAAYDALAAAGARIGTPYLAGRVRLSAARVALAAGDPDEARRAGEDAVDRLADCGAPYDAAVARIELARALRALDRGDAAATEARTARDALAALGAARELATAEALLATPATAATPAAAAPASAAPAAAAPALAALAADTAAPAALAPATAAPAGDLSPREVEVLRLVAQGLSDGEIALRLVLSPHTVHRHVANVRTKLRLPSRTAAVAFAARSGVL